MATSQAFELDPAVIDEIADRLSDAIVERVVEAIRAEGLIPQGRTTMSWLDTKEVAERLGVELEWGYEHAEELGASRIGTGPRPRLRFPAHILDSRSGKPTSPEAASEPAKRRSGPDGLIPIHGS